MADGSGHALMRSFVAVPIGVIALTSLWMPERVASHFGADGLANGYITRGTYVAFLAGVAIGIPTLLSLGIGATIRRSPGALNIPNRDYWLAPARQQESVDFLVGHTARPAAGVAIFALGLHFVLIHANSLSPPRLEGAWAITPLAGGLAGVAVWIIALSRRFRLP